MKLFDQDRPPAFWQKRFYDFNVYSKKKIAEKLNYMHNNPVKRGLVKSREQWAWSSYRSFRFMEKGPVRIDV
jgi:putative transposase